MLGKDWRNVLENGLWQIIEGQPNCYKPGSKRQHMTFALLETLLFSPLSESVTEKRLVRFLTYPFFREVQSEQVQGPGVG